MVQEGVPVWSTHGEEHSGLGGQFTSQIWRADRIVPSVAFLSFLTPVLNPFLCPSAFFLLSGVFLTRTALFWLYLNYQRSPWMDSRSSITTSLLNELLGWLGDRQHSVISWQAKGEGLRKVLQHQLVSTSRSTAGSTTQRCPQGISVRQIARDTAQRF